MIDRDLPIRIFSLVLFLSPSLIFDSVKGEWQFGLVMGVKERVGGLGYRKGRGVRV